MTNYWNQSGIPHKGWTLKDVIDLRESGQSESETDYETCMMCGHEKIRYVHIVHHNENNIEYRVGCNCAEKMTNDYVTSRQHENNLRKRADRRTNWLKKEWKISKNGNYYLKIKENLIVIFQVKGTNFYKVSIKERPGSKTFVNLEDAKIAAFDGIEYFKRKGEW